MMKQALILSLMITSLSLSTGAVLAADQTSTSTQEKAQKKVYGSQLMTKQERKEFRATMRAAKTDKERAEIRKKHHEKMKKRAKERGVTIPDEPPVKRGRINSNGGMGAGAGGGRGRGQ